MLQASTGPIQVLIVDDHPVVRAGLASMLGTQSELDLIGSAPSGEDALRMVEERRPDLLLLDLRMPAMSGVETLQALKAAGRSVRVVILTNYETDEDIYCAVQAGAQGYLLKNTARELEILKLLSKGPTNKQIGRILGISDNTVRNHVLKIIEKLEVSDRTEAATIAIQRGLITVDD